MESTGGGGKEGMVARVDLNTITDCKVPRAESTTRMRWDIHSKVFIAQVIVRVPQRA